MSKRKRIKGQTIIYRIQKLSNTKLNTTVTMSNTPVRVITVEQIYELVALHKIKH